MDGACTQPASTVQVSGVGRSPGSGPVTAATETEYDGRPDR